MTTTTTRPDRKAQQDTARANAERLAEIAARMLAKHDFTPDRRPVVAEAFGRALAGTSPTEPHGQLLAACLRPARFGDRPAPERAAFRLARLGETPTAAAVAGYLAGQRDRAESRDRLEVAITARVAVDGPAAAAHVARVVADTGEGPTWFELATAMRWGRKPKALSDGIIRRLARAGYLEFTTEPRSLRPGPTATDQERK